MYYNTSLNKIITFCEIVSEGLQKNSEAYGDGGEFSKSPYFQTKKVVEELGFVEPNGVYVLKLTSRGEKVLGSKEERQEAFRNGIKENDLLSELLSRVQSKVQAPHQTVNKSQIESEIEDMNPGMSKTTKESARRLFMSLVQEAGIGSVHKRGRQKVLKIKELPEDQGTVTVSKSIQEASESDDSEAQTEKPTLRGKGYSIELDMEGDGIEANFSVQLENLEHLKKLILYLDQLEVDK